MVSTQWVPRVSFMNYLFLSEYDLVKTSKGYSCDKVNYYYTEKIRGIFTMLKHIADFCLPLRVLQKTC